jgi:hypothetical protein
MSQLTNVSNLMPSDTNCTLKISPSSGSVNIITRSTIERHINKRLINNFDELRSDHGMSLRLLFERLRMSIIEKSQRYRHGTQMRTVFLKQNVKSGSVSDHVIDVF